MFRTTCDNSLTTSQPASPPTANLAISTCPPPSQSCPKTSPRQSGALPHHRTPTAHRNPSRQPFRDPHAPTPAGPTGPVIPLRHCDSRISRPQHQSASAAWPTGTPTKHSHLPADDGDQDRVIVAADDHRGPGSPTQTDPRSALTPSTTSKPLISAAKAPVHAAHREDTDVKADPFTQLDSHVYKPERSSTWAQSAICDPTLDRCWSFPLSSMLW